MLLHQQLLLYSRQLAQMLLLVNEEIQNKHNLHNPLRLPYLPLLRLPSLLLMKLAPRIQLHLLNLPSSRSKLPMLLLHVGFEAKLAQQELIFKLIIKCGIDIESILAFIILYKR